MPLTTTPLPAPCHDAPRRAVWLDPPGPPPQALRDGSRHQRFHGTVAGAWGGNCFGSARVDAGTMAFHAELRLDAGQAVNAGLRAGGHGQDWVWADDPAAPPGRPLAIALHLWLATELCTTPRPRGGWGADPGGGAFVGSEDDGRQPLALRTRLDAAQPGARVARSQHVLLLPNRGWARVPSRFAARLHSSGAHWLHWSVSASVRLEAPPGVQLRLAPATTERAPDAPSQLSAAAVAAAR